MPTIFQTPDSKNQQGTLSQDYAAICDFFLITPCDSRSGKAHWAVFDVFFCGKSPGRESNPDCWDGNPAFYHCTTLTRYPDSSVNLM